MPASRTTTREKAPDLTTSLGDSGEKEYRRLVRAVRMGYGSFFLFPIESNYPTVLRDALLARLGTDLAAEGLTLRVAALTRDCWDVFDTSALESAITSSDVVVLVGLEETPGIVPEAGAKPTRPPALALLNSARETLHRHAPAPLLVWCPPFAYTALMEHAPDFFDHYTGLFQFPDAAPEARPAERVTVSDTRPPERASAPNKGGSRAALEFYERLVAENPKPTHERARALIGLAIALSEWQGPGYTARLERACTVVEEALSLLSPERDAYEWARGQNALGIILSTSPKGSRNENLHRAIDCFKAALTVYNKVNFPEQWAMTQNNLGITYSDLPSDSTGKNLRQAIRHYKAALEVYTRENFPEGWANTQNNLGTAYGRLPSGERDKNLRNAIHYLEAALQVYTEASYPIDWSMIQTNLGNAYSYLQVDNQSVTLRRAIACYKAALRIRTEADFPVQWAVTQNNMGVAYAGLSTGQSDNNLRLAVICYEAALRIRTEVNFPGDWATTQCNLARVHYEKGNIMEAVEALQKALRGYRTVGLEQKAQEVEIMLNELSQAE